MKTLQNHIEENQLVANIVRSEIENGRTVYLVVIEGTDRTMVTSQPSIFGGENVDGGIGAISIEGDATGRDKYSTPIDEISSVENLPGIEIVSEGEKEEKNIRKQGEWSPLTIEKAISLSNERKEIQWKSDGYNKAQANWGVALISDIYKSLRFKNTYGIIASNISGKDLNFAKSEGDVFWFSDADRIVYFKELS